MTTTVGVAVSLNGWLSTAGILLPTCIRIMSDHLRARRLRWLIEELFRSSSKRTKMVFVSSGGGIEEAGAVVQTVCNFDVALM
jgi:hypothetical protein